MPAIKFSEPGGRLLGGTSDEGGRRLAARVQDFGAGSIASVFLPFEERGSLGERGGLGLGHAICKGIADAHGGTLRARSDRVGRGSTFELHLPLDEVAAQPSPGTEPGGRPDASACVVPPPARRLRILIVEDHADTAEMLALFLARLGHEVVLDRSLADGLGRLAEWWDVIVSDIALGDGSGLAIAHRARAAPQRPGVLVALTGFGARDGAAASRRAGFDHHLVKPVDLDALRALIERPGVGSASGASAEPA